MVQRIVIDADPGICDSLAIMTAFADPQLDVVGLTATAGTVSGLQATRNIQLLVETLDLPRYPRIGQSTAARSPAAEVDSGEWNLLNGKHGLGDCEVNIPDRHNRGESAKLIVELVREHPNEIVLLALGPLSNIALACELDPELPQLLSGLVILGGSRRAGGDVTAAAEFNMWCDPDAAYVVLHSHAPITMIPLDVSRQPNLSFEDADTLTGMLPESRVGKLIDSLLQYSLRAHRQLLALESVRLESLAALAVAARAEEFATHRAIVDIETEGRLTRGVTVFDERSNERWKSNVEVVDEIHSGGVVDYFVRAARRLAQTSE